MTKAKECLKELKTKFDKVPLDTKKKVAYGFVSGLVLGYLLRRK